jgi:hypothetical protein
MLCNSGMLFKLSHDVTWLNHSPLRCMGIDLQPISRKLLKGEGYVCPRRALAAGHYLLGGLPAVQAVVNE